MQHLRDRAAGYPDDQPQPLFLPRVTPTPAACDKPSDNNNNASTAFPTKTMTIESAPTAQAAVRTWPCGFLAECGKDTFGQTINATSNAASVPWA